MPSITRFMDKTTLREILQNLAYIMTSELFIGSKRQLESGALEMAEQDVDVLRIDQPLLRRLIQKIVGMVDDVLIERRTRCDQNRNGHPAAAARTSHALPGRSDCAGITRQNSDVEAADVNSQLKGVG